MTASYAFIHQSIDKNYTTLLKVGLAKNFIFYQTLAIYIASAAYLLFLAH